MNGFRVENVKIKQRGFTLVELLIVMAIVAILSAYAFPMYQDSVQRGKVAQATSTLSDLRMQIEQHYQDNLSYVGFPCNVPADVGSAFTYVCAAPDANTYTLTATGIAAQGMPGFVYTINQSNAKTSSYKGGATQNCWTTKRGQTC